jgi:hypothetical protein
MNNYCAFDKKHKCVLWQDYQLTRSTLEEAHETCHGNWIEIQHLRDYIGILEAVLKEHGIDIPKEI